MQYFVHYLNQMHTCITVDWLRSFVADYGVTLMVVVRTALSYAVPDKLPAIVPRRLFSSSPWEPSSLQHWTVSKVTTLSHFFLTFWQVII